MFCSSSWKSSRAFLFSFRLLWNLLNSLTVFSAFSRYVKASWYMSWYSVQRTIPPSSKNFVLVRCSVNWSNSSCKKATSSSTMSLSSSRAISQASAAVLSDSSSFCSPSDFSASSIRIWVTFVARESLSPVGSEHFASFSLAILIQAIKSLPASMNNSCLSTISFSLS